MPAAFSTTWLTQCANAFERRRKAIRYQARGFTLERDVDPDGYERLNVDVPSNGNDTSIRLSLWSDRTMWFYAARSGPRRRGGWQFLVAFHGYADSLSASELVSLFEDSLLQIDYPRDPARRFYGLLDAWEDVDPVLERAIPSHSARDAG